MNNEFDIPFADATGSDGLIEQTDNSAEEGMDPVDQTPTTVYVSTEAEERE